MPKLPPLKPYRGPDLPNEGPVVVAGGAGQLGQWMVRRLFAQGVTDVRVIDVNAYPGPEPVQSVRCDLSDAASLPRLQEALNGARTVVSMVMPALLTASESDHHRCNVDGVLQLLDASRAAGVRNFVYISSIAVMDHFTHHHDANEDDLPEATAYQSCYDQTKRIAEDAVLAAHAEDGMWTCSLRLGSLICSSRSLQLRGLLGPIAMVQDPGKPIDTNHGMNAAWGIWLAMRALDDRDPAAGGEAFLLTRGEPLSVLDVAQKISVRTDSLVVVWPTAFRWLVVRVLSILHHLAGRLGAHRPGLPTHFLFTIPEYEQTFSNAKAERILGYRPLITLDDAFDLIVSGRNVECIAQPRPQAQIASFVPVRTP